MNHGHRNITQILYRINPGAYIHVNMYSVLTRVNQYCQLEATVQQNMKRNGPMLCGQQCRMVTKHGVSYQHETVKNGSGLGARLYLHYVYDDYYYMYLQKKNLHQATGARSSY